MSFAKNSSGGKEVIEVNDYYAFGMNHLGTDNLTGFGQGAYENYKYNGKELQETGFLDYGWRQYMPELGRWFGMDQLSESYLSTSPYAYVLNSPVMNSDPDGRLTQFAMAGDGTGGEERISTGLGTQPGTAGGGGVNWGNWGTGDGGNSEFGSTAAYQDAMSFLQGNSQGTFNLKNNNGRLTWWTDVQMTGIAGDIQGLDGHTMKLENSSVGQPGEWESMIPIWGSGRAAVDHFQNGNYWRGAAYTALAVSDVFLVKSLATGLSRGAWKLGSHSWSATRKWMMKKGYAGANEPLHHWLITQKVSKKYGLEAVANQPWNLLKFSSQSMHMRAGHGMRFYGEEGFGIMGQLWHGTPGWAKVGAFSTLGHGAQLGSYQFSPEDY